MFDKNYDRVAFIAISICELVIDNLPTVCEELFSRTQRDSKSLQAIIANKR